VGEKKRYTLGIIPGDGIGRDVVGAAQRVLDTINEMAETFTLDFLNLDAGESAMEKYGNPFPQETFDGIKKAHAVLFGAAGPPHTAQVLRGFRQGFDLYAKVCPIKSLPGIRTIHSKADLIIIRENTEGLYGGKGYVDGDRHVSLRVFTRKGMERIIRFSFELALKKKRKKVTFTHKAAALPHTDEPMRQMFHKIAKEYPGIEAEDMMIDACAMQIVMKPGRLDVVIAENANGDILSDVGAGITGGLGLACSGNMGDSTAVFEPIHGTAPKYADKNVVNPVAAIMAGKMMFDYLGETKTASQIEQAVKDVLVDGKVRTYDLGGTSSTTEVAEAICEKMIRNCHSEASERK
jgi:isocitrate dehydrogenase (NAD+)